MIDINKANEKAIQKVLNAQPFLVGMGIARDVIPGMHENLFLHAGPPITWEKMSGPMRGAVMGALMYEGRANTPEEAEKIAESGEIEFSPCHEYGAVGPMAGVTSPSMPVYIVENREHGNKAFSNMNEGYGKVLRYGAYDEEVLGRLKWFDEELYPLLKKAIELSGGIDMKSMIAQQLQMGDEGHNRNKAGTSLLIRTIAEYVVKTKADHDVLERAFNFMNSNDLFNLNALMASCKATMDAAHGIEGSTLVTVMARNGTEFGIRVSGLGDRWFTGPVQQPDGLYFSGYTAEDANGDIGDSTITETSGIGAFAMASAPAIVQFISGSPDMALEATNEMYEITIAENNAFGIPILDFRGSPTGIDIRKVIETGILPKINTGIAHKNPGVGQVGAGLVTPPMNCFEDALEAFAETLAEA
ncbi:MAG: DUF1116 domain-containing protein [Clostridiaceae bacterium]|nr:DUF1116 domain-containing protein [Clostridiaceae bacterium]